MPEPVESAHRYMPGLDGLRAIAVLAVIAYKLELGWAQGGLLGVGVFFTLSGYLITDLLLEQREAIGRLRLGDFWLRRARRLLPALFLMLAVVAVWVALLEPSQLPALRADVIAAVLYVSNWWYIFQDVSYFAQFGPPPPLGHLWSLAVEEQFYVVWPLLLWLGLRYVRGRYRLAGLTLAAAALSATLMALLYEPGLDATRVYDGTDTRAFGLLLGAALAMVWPSRSLRAHLTPVGSRRERRYRLRIRRLLLDGAGVAGLVVIALLIWRTDQYSPFLYRGGMVLLSVATVGVVAAVVHPASRLGRALGWGPLRWIGVRSYGIYLWAYPIIVLTTPTVQGRTDLPVEVLQVGATIAVAALSWRFFEEPIRRGAIERFWTQVRSGGWRPGAVPPRSWIASVGTIGVMALAGAGLAGAMPAITPDDGRSLPPPGEADMAIQDSSKQSASAAPPASTPAPSSSARAVSDGRRQRTTGETAPENSSPEATPATRTSCEAVAYVGDSTSEGMISPNYLPDPTQRLDARFARVGAASQSFDISGARSIVETLPGQTNGEEAARRLVREGFRGCWVIALGGNDTANVYAGSQVGLKDRIERMMSVIGGQPVLWVNTKTLLQSGPYSNANMELWNRTLEEACARYPNMRVYDWASAVEDSWFISDGTHFTSEGYAQRARLTAGALARAFPASGEGNSSCVVQ